MIELTIVIACFVAGLSIGLTCALRVVKANRNYLDLLGRAVGNERETWQRLANEWQAKAIEHEVQARFWFEAFEQQRLKHRRQLSDEPQFNPDDPDWWKR